MAITTYWKIQTPDSTTPISTSAWTEARGVFFYAGAGY